MPPPDPHRLAMLQAALGGAALYGLWLLAALVAAGQTPTRADYVRAAVNIVCACVAGGLIAWFVGPQLVGLIPFNSMRDPTAVGFVIGAAGWELLPLLLKAIKARGQKEIDKLGGGQ